MKKYPATLKEQFEQIANQYVDTFCKKQEMHLEFWTGIGEIACVGDYHIGFDNIRYDVDNNVPADLILTYMDEMLEENYKKDRGEEFNMPNYENWLTINHLFTT